jgi:hypothetical protein
MSPECPIRNAATMGAHAVELDDARGRGGDSVHNVRLGVGDLGIETPDIRDEPERQALALGLGEARGLHLPKDRSRTVGGHRTPVPPGTKDRIRA